MLRAIVSVLILARVSASRPKWPTRYSFAHTKTVNSSDVDFYFGQELASSFSAHRVDDLETELRDTFVALPTNSDGHLSHLTTFYALHRLFNRRHGWFIKGLEPDSFDKTNATAGPNASLKSWTLGWVPDYLIEKLQTIRPQVRTSGVNLKELVAMAATLEDLIHVENTEMLAAIYKGLGYRPSDSLKPEEVEQVTDTYIYVMLCRGEIFFNSTIHLNEKRLRYYDVKYKEYPKLSAWLRRIEAPYQRLEPVQRHGANFSIMSTIVATMAHDFAVFNEDNCVDLKSRFIDLESRSGKIGRVRLQDFYNQTLYSRWKLNEHIDYLRALGVLDESNPKVPYVIASNYIYARSNCLEGSSVHAICCKNECENLMTQLEGNIGSPSADPDLVAQLVMHMGSATVDAPRDIPPSLLQRLKQVAGISGGRVNLQGRLFAQWMHHAYPRECAYPHEKRTLSPQDPADWLQGSGRTSHTLSDAELRAIIGEDVCPAEGPCELSDAGLPWSDIEELYADDGSRPHVQHDWYLLQIPILVLMLVVVGMRVFTSTSNSTRYRISKRMALLIAFLSVMGATCIACVDQTLFAFMMLGIATQTAMNSVGYRCTSVVGKAKGKCDEDVCA